MDIIGLANTSTRYPHGIFDGSSRTRSRGGSSIRNCSGRLGSHMRNYTQNGNPITHIRNTHGNYKTHIQVK